MKYINDTSLLNRKVGPESSRTYSKKLNNGFFDKYMSGKGLELGYRGDQSDKEQTETILPTAIGIDKDFPDYDGIHLPFLNESQDFVYHSHTIEHIQDCNTAIKDWMRVLKVGGYLVIVAPHKFLYERKNFLPSILNDDHKHFFTPGSLLKVVEDNLEPNSYRIRLLEDGDDGYDYTIEYPNHPSGQYEILLCIQKIKKPTWQLK